MTKYYELLWGRQNILLESNIVKIKEILSAIVNTDTFWLANKELIQP